MKFYSLDLCGLSAVLGIAAMVSTAASNLSESSASTEPIAQIRHNNGAQIFLNGDPITFAGEFSPIKAGDVIEMGRGFTDFNLLVFQPDNLHWEVQIFPGNSSASFHLENYNINTNEPFTEVTPLPSGQGDVIAYGLDSNNPNPVVLKALPIETDRAEFTMGLWPLVAIGGMVYSRLNANNAA